MAEGIGFLLMAAGRSSRFGSNKLQYSLSPTKTLFETTLHGLLKVTRRVAVVSSSDSELVQQAAQAAGVKNIIMPTISAGLSESIAYGVAATENWRGWGIYLADMPYIGSQVLRELVGHAERHPIVRPVYRGKPGHPVLFQRRFFSELTTINGKDGARAVIERNKTLLYTVSAEDSGVVEDIDYPSDVR